MRTKTWVGAVGAALFTAACAGGPREGPPPGFGDDEPGEGPRPPRAQLFISPAGQPFRAPGGQPYPVADWFAKADADRDGRLTRGEFRADADAWFTVLDANADGQISMPEVSRWEEQLVPEMSRVGVGMAPADPRRRGGGGVNTRLQGAAAYSLINEPHPIRGADADFSFSVSRAEWRAASDRRFALLDVDADGAILAADLRPTPVQTMRAGDGERSMHRRPAIGVLKRQR